MSKWILLVALVVLGFVVVSSTGVLAGARDAPGKVESLVSGAKPVRQSAEQLSQFEFNSVRPGTRERRLRALVGDPSSRQDVTVEGIDVECWYYGVARATGAYQFCFQNGRLRTKTRYNTLRLR